MKTFMLDLDGEEVGYEELGEDESIEEGYFIGDFHGIVHMALVSAVGTLTPSGRLDELGEKFPRVAQALGELSEAYQDALKDVG